MERHPQFVHEPVARVLHLHLYPLKVCDGKSLRPVLVDAEKLELVWGAKDKTRISFPVAAFRLAVHLSLTAANWEMDSPFFSGPP